MKTARLLLLVTLSLPAFAAEPNWPQWRGPNWNGHSSESNLPVKWSADSVAWKTSLKGEGNSSPVIWGDQIFLTYSLEKGKQRCVAGLSRTDGAVQWEHVAWTGEPEASHALNGWASATCATDGQHVIAFFGKGGLHGYSVAGKHLWSRDLGDFKGPWGTAASPVLVGNLAIQNCDAEGEAYLLAVDKATGETVWKTPRKTPERGGWSTPVLVEAGARRELVLNGATHVTGYDPVTGQQLWTCKSFSGRGDPTATFGGGLVYLVNGQPGDIYAVKPGGTGDVTKSQMAWHTPRKSGRDEPSPIVIGNHLLVISMGGILSCYKADTGEELWKDRLNAKFSSSPIAAGGLAYFQSDDGETFVVEPGPALKVVAQNAVASNKGEVFHASLSAAGGRIYSRSDRTLYCIGQTAK